MKKMDLWNGQKSTFGISKFPYTWNIFHLENSKTPFKFKNNY